MADPRPLDALTAAGDPSQRRYAISRVYRLEGDPDEVQAALFALLGDEDPGVRRATVELIQRTGMTDAVGNALAQAIRDEHLARRASAVEACGRLGGAAIGLLASLLGEASEGLRRLAVDALGLTGSKAATQALSRASTR